MTRVGRKGRAPKARPSFLEPGTVGAEEVHDELLRIALKARTTTRTVGEFIDAEHELHRVVRRLADDLDQAIFDGFTHDQAFSEGVWADPATQRPGEDARLQRRDSRPSVELRVPGWLVSLDTEVQEAVSEGVPRRGSRR